MPCQTKNHLLSLTKNALLPTTSNSLNWLPCATHFIFLSAWCFHQRNRERIAKESAKSLSTHFRLVKEAVSKLGGDKEKMQVVLSHLDDVNHKIPIIGGEAVGTLDRIQKLLTAAPILETSETVNTGIEHYVKAVGVSN